MKRDMTNEGGQGRDMLERFVPPRQESPPGLRQVNES